MESSFLVGLIGAGVGPSLSPALHMREAAEHGLSYVYKTIDITALGVPAEGVGDLLRDARRLGFDALNITHPCKELVIEHLDQLDDTAARMGAVNTVVFGEDGAVGYNTDTTGFAHALRTGMPDAPRGTVVQLGAGGAGSAVAHALLRQGAGRLVVADMDLDRAQARVEDLRRHHPESTVEASDVEKLAALLPDADGLVNCTPVGMADHPGTPLDTSLLHPDLWVADIVYRPLDTALLQAAREAGCRTLHGGHMAVYQAVDALRLITGIEPDATRMLAHLRELAAAG
ncbi:shikimate dehydrogenase [Nocardioides luteus]|uniref:Shikimate dehydrogenase (NADP(+)) n=1 Tax=Nocardioides luteus TaxID=1844 RepID=A0ABQ5T2A2_9ACTN|nr:shikimate dehydrogenase [Nocardioides luteus]MDR7310246.1 shikimate dehydrogenase [Nocardioides luteus]GGR53948.1 shikimate dehydrogenase (NADP(+)) [Nocardioides luteus]GLJ69975.1 shikimate dehydrogenase (NADP(+)) [Nocardioides luteus]